MLRSAYCSDRVTVDRRVRIRRRWFVPFEPRVETIPSLLDGRLDDLAATYPNALAPTYVPQSQDIKNAQHEGRTIFALDEPSSTAQRARKAYEKNATALLNRLGKQRVEVR